MKGIYTLVTGGMGFIGSHLVRRLLECNSDRRVIALDDLSNDPLVDYETIVQYRRQPFTKLPTRLRDKRVSLCSNWYNGQNGHHPTLDAIYHLASPVGAVGILPHSGNIIRRIVDDTYAVIKLAQMNNCRLVYVSTSEIYGGGVDGLCAEDTPRHIAADTTARLEYAIGKLAGETAVLNTPDLDAVIIRPFNVCGTRQRSKGGFVLPRFIEQALAGHSLTVFGDGSAVRAFTNVADIVDGLLLAMDKGGTKQAYNLGNPTNKTTVLDLAKRVQHMVNEVEIQYTDGKTLFGDAYSEANDKYPDATKAMFELGWLPSRTIEETISEVAAYMRERVK